jgi:hypothetical protein
VKFDAKWIRRHAVTIVCVVIYLGLLGALAHRSYAASTRLKTIELQLDRDRAELQNIQRKQPYPSPKNIETIRESRRELENRYQELLRLAGRVYIEPPRIEPIDFAAELTRKIVELNELARRRQVVLPPGPPYAFGFGRYTDTLVGVNLPREQAAELAGKLSKQLSIIEVLARTMFESGIEELISIRRVDLEFGRVGDDTLDAKVYNDPDELYVVMPFEVQVVATTDALRDLLNTLSKSEWYFVVRWLQIGTDELPLYPDDKPPTAPTAPRGPVRGVAPGAPAAAAAPAIETRNVLLVSARVDYIEFPAAPRQE